MKHIRNFETFVNESNEELESTDLTLESYLEEAGENANYDDAMDYLAENVTESELTEDEFEEAKAAFLTK